MKSRPTLFLVAVLCTASCDPDETKTITTLVNFTVDASYKTAVTDDWIIIHNAAGEAITFETFESNDSRVIQTDKSVRGNSIGVTLLKYYREGNKNYDLTTYLNLPKGKEITLQSAGTSSVEIPGSTIGKFTIKLSLGDAVDHYWLSNKYSEVCGPSGLIENLGNEEFTCDIRDTAPNYLLQMSDENDNLSYKMLENVKPGDFFDISKDDLVEFDKVVDFKLPPSNDIFILLTGREPDVPLTQPGYVFNLHYHDDHHESIKVGYLNRLSDYSTDLRVGYPGYAYTYYNVGSVPSAVQWPLPTDFEVTSNSISNFSSTAEVSFVSRSTSFRYRDPVSGIIRADWRVRSSSTDHTLGELPAEILAAHSSLALKNFQYSASAFFTESRPYSEILTPFLGHVYTDVSISIYN